MRTKRRHISSRADLGVAVISQIDFVEPFPTRTCQHDRNKPVKEMWESHGIADLWWTLRV